MQNWNWDLSLNCHIEPGITFHLRLHRINELRNRLGISQAKRLNSTQHNAFAVNLESWKFTSIAEMEKKWNKFQNLRKHSCGCSSFLLDDFHSHTIRLWEMKKMIMQKRVPRDVFRQQLGVKKFPGRLVVSTTDKAQNLERFSIYETSISVSSTAQ